MVLGPSLLVQDGGPEVAATTLIDAGGTFDEASSRWEVTIGAPAVLWKRRVFR